MCSKLVLPYSIFLLDQRDRHTYLPTKSMELNHLSLSFLLLLTYKNIYRVSWVKSGTLLLVKILSAEVIQSPNYCFIIYAVSIMAKGRLPCTEKIFCGRWHQYNNMYNDPTHNRFFFVPTPLWCSVYMILILIDNDHVRVVTVDIDNVHRAVHLVYLSFTGYLAFMWISEPKCSILRWWWTSANWFR